MIKYRVGGKYAGMKKGRDHNYKFVGVFNNGAKVVGATVQADSVKEAEQKARQEFAEVIKNSVVEASKFESILASNKTSNPETWDADRWKREKEKAKKKKS